MNESEQIETLLRQFYANQGQLRGYIFSSTKDYHATEEILQSTAITIAQKAAQFDSERPCMNWFMGICKNHIQRYYQKQKRESKHISFEILDDFIPMLEVFDAHQLSTRRQALESCMTRLPKKQRKVIELRYMENQDCSQIADHLGRSVQGIYSLLKRLKVDLRKCVEFQLQNREMI
jgi:RNA polymerase sigma-70 factor, ECF subfamily